MYRSLEVRVRTGISLLFVGVASLGLGLGTARAAQATPSGSQQTTTPPATVPAPTQEDQDQIESMPGYRQGQSGQAQPTDQQQPTNSAPTTAPAAGTGTSAPQTLPAPQKAPPPVVTPDAPTPQNPYTAMPAYAPAGTPEKPGRTWGDPLGSAYIPVDSWVYPAMMRLYSLGYLDTMYLAMRPYTRRSALHMLQAGEDAILGSDDTQEQDILAALMNELTDEGITSEKIAGTQRGTVYGVQSVYTRVMGVSGPILQDSFHLGQTFFNDYGRPHETGFNNITGFSTLTEQGPF